MAKFQLNPGETLIGSGMMLSKKVVKGIDMDYARSFAIKTLLYLFHDRQEANYPAILKHKEIWK